MVYMKYLASALAAASVVAAQGGSGCDSKTIENPSDASGLSSCRTINGDVEISSKYENELVLDGVERITGSLICEACSNITSLEAPKLEEIGKMFTVDGATKLRTLRCDSLESVGDIKFVALPKLQNLQFEKGISKAGRIEIVNTDLRSLDGIELESTKGMTVSNNLHLTRANVSQITNATGQVSFSANSLDLEISFPNLEQAQNMTFRNTSVVELPSLEKASGLLGFYSNYFEKFSAPKLTSTGDLVFNDNSNVKNISLPGLEEIDGAFQVANNTKLGKFNGSPKLSEISGTIDFTGNFSSLKLPALKEVGGETNIQSSGPLDCDKDGLNDLEGDTRGEFKCEGDLEDPQSTDPTGTSDEEEDSDESGNAAPGNIAPESPALMAVLAVLGAFQFAL